LPIRHHLSASTGAKEIGSDSRTTCRNEQLQQAQGLEQTSAGIGADAHGVPAQGVIESPATGAQGSTMTRSISASIYSKKIGQFAVIAVIEITSEPYYPHVSLNYVCECCTPTLTCGYAEAEC
jgi:hypothetical protein